MLTAAIAAVLAFPTAARAEEITGTFAQAGIKDVEYYGSDENTSLSVQLNSSSTVELLVGVGKVVNKGAKQITVASWDTYDVDGNNPVYVNLYKKLNKGKDNYIVLRTGISSPACVLKRAKASKKVIKAKFDPATGKVKVGSGDSASEVVLKDMPEAEYYSFGGYSLPNKLYLEGSAFSKENIDYCQMSGGMFYIYYGGGWSSPVEQITNETYTFEDQQVKVYDLGHMSSKVIKLKIPARANGPKIGVDYVNGTVKFPKNSEYRISTSNKLQEAVNDKYTTSPDGATEIEKIRKDAVAANILTENDKKFNLEVRTVATDKKVASKWSHLSIEVPSGISESELKAGNNVKNSVPQPGNEEQKVGGNGVAKAEVKEDTTKVLDISYVKKGKITDTKQQNNAVQIKNTGKLTYEVVISKADAKEAPTDVKATKIAPNKTVLLTKDAEDGALIWIRKAGDKKKQIWVGKYGQLGKIDYEFVVPAKEK